VVVADSYLHHAPLFDETLAELRRVLAPGGLLAFTVRFHGRSPHTVSHTEDSRHGRAGGKGETHEIGWDILLQTNHHDLSRSHFILGCAVLATMKQKCDRC
jgi:hypothetical protein